MAAALAPQAPRLLASRAQKRAAPPFARTSRRPLRVAAFKHHDPSRRTQLKDTADEVARWYASAIVEGNGRTLSGLSIELDSEVLLRVHHPLGCASYKGLAAIGEKLANEHTTRYGARGGPPPGAPQLIASAASDTSDVAFCLLELPPSAAEQSAAAQGDVQAGAQGQAPASYMVLQMDLLLDDGARRVTRITERAQLVSDHDAAVQGVREVLRRRRQAAGAAAAPEPRGATATAAALGAPFPKAQLQPWRPGQAGPGAPAPSPTAPGALPPGEHEAGSGDVEAHAMAALRSLATLTGSDSPDPTEQELNQIMDMQGYRLYDAYGLMPLLSGLMMEGGGADGPGAGSSSGGSSITAGQLMSLIKASKRLYDVNTTIVDAAISAEHAVGFAHTLTQLTSRKSGRQWDVRGMEVALFEPATGRLTGTYLLRDATQFEDAMVAGANAVAE